MEQIRKDAIAEVNRRAEPGGDLQSFLDVHKVIKDPPAMGEYRYGEEFEGDMPKKGEHSVTAVDKQVEKASKDDLVALSDSVEAIPGGECLADREAALLMDRIKGLKAVKADNAIKGVPGCRFLLDKQIVDLERCKEGLEKGPSMDTLACLHQKLRLERLLHINERDIARAKWSKEKKKDMKKLLNAKLKKRLWNRRMEIRAAKMDLMK